jgi:hypothetical protein
LANLRGVFIRASPPTALKLHVHTILDEVMAFCETQFGQEVQLKEIIAFNWLANHNPSTSAKRGTWMMRGNWTNTPFLGGEVSSFFNKEIVEILGLFSLL